MRTRYHILDTLAHREFFDTIDMYQPDASYYMQPVRELLPQGWTTQRSGVWFHSEAPDARVPAEGWKIHVSASTHTAPDVLQAVVPVLVDERVSFKCCADRVLLSLMNSKRWNRGGSGKFITVYPRDTEHFLRLLERLHGATAGFDGPYILSDRRYRDSRVLFYRYGTMLMQTALNASGNRVSVFVDNDGKLVEDSRNPVYTVPPWIDDPLAEPDQAPAQAAGPVLLRDGKYRVEHAIAFSNSGGVYLAMDTVNDRPCVVKEARPRTNWVSADLDAPALLRKEHRLLDKLRNSGYTPEPFELFTDWEHTFLAQEKVQGFTLHTTGVLNSPLIMQREKGDFERFFRNARDIFVSLAAAISAVHDENIVFGDLSPTNILWNEEHRRIILIDLEGAIERGVDTPPRLTTLGFEAPGMDFGYEPSFDDDWYSYAALFVNYVLPIAEFLRFPGVSTKNLVERLCDEAQLPAALTALVLSLLSPESNRRPRVDAFLDELRRLPATAKPRPFSPYEKPVSRDAVEAIGSYIVSVATPERADRLFPSDFRLFSTNPLSLSYGALGVIGALHRAEIPYPAAFAEWTLRTDVRPEKIPPGLNIGLAGIAWNLWDIGRRDEARRVLAMGEGHPLLARAPGLAIGRAGWGLTNLRFHLETGEQRYLDETTASADELLRTAQRDANGLRWERDGVLSYGLYHGASGIGLFLLYVGLQTGSRTYLDAAVDALRFEMSRAQVTPDGTLSWSYGTDFENIYLPYLAYGASGVGAALARFIHLGGYTEFAPAFEGVFADTDRLYSVSRGIDTGLAGIGAFHLDAYELSGERRFLEAAERIYDVLSMYAVPRAAGTAFAGDAMMRITCDYGTGSAGVLSFADRLQRGTPSPYLLDRYFASPAQRHDALAAGARA